MTKEDIIMRNDTEHGVEYVRADSVRDLLDKSIAAERNKIAQWMIDRSYATGHGDTIEDLITELEWQVREEEREACAQVCEKIANKPQNMVLCVALNCAEAIRGEK